MVNDFKDGCWLFGVLGAFNSPFRGGFSFDEWFLEASPRLSDRVDKSV